MYYLELVVVGIVWGCTYAMMALGLTLVYGLLRILHIAHAAVFTLGAYIGLLTSNIDGNLLLAFPAAMLVAGIVGPLIYRIVYEPILHQPPYVALIASIGVLIAMEDGFRIAVRALWPVICGKPLVHDDLRRGRHYVQYCPALDGCGRDHPDFRIRAVQLLDARRRRLARHRLGPAHCIQLWR